MSKILNIILGTLLAVSLIFILFQHLSAPDVTRLTPEIKYDTIVEIKHDTITITKEKIKYVDRKIIDTVFIKDETKLFVEQRHYCDTFSDIFVSGILPKVDSVIYKIPEKTIYVDKVIEVPKKDSFWKNRFVITAGFSTTYGLVHGKWDVGPSVTVGIRLY